MDLMLANPLTVIEKSRKVMATWMAVVRFLWMAQFWPGREVIFQCKMEQESKDRLLNPAWFIYEHQPAWFRQYHPAIKKDSTIEFYELERDEMNRFSNRALADGRPFKPKPTGSRIIAIPEGDGPWRGPTVSGGIIDEAAHFQAFDSVLTAAQASVEASKSVRPLVIISTPKGKGRFWRLAHDLEGQSLVSPEKEVSGEFKAHPGCIWPGMRWRKNSNGWMSIFIHHSVDLEKDADATTEGKVFRERIESHYKGDPLGLAREYDLSSEVGAGLPVYGLAFNAALNVTRTAQYQRGKTVYRGWDFGYRRPFCVWAFEDDEDTLVVLYEMMGQDILIHEFADQVLDLSRKWFGWLENGKAEMPRFRDFCDPAGAAKSDKSKRSSVEVLNSKAIYPGFLHRGIDEGLVSVRQLLRPREKLGTPELTFHERCHILIEGMKGGYHYPEENPTRPEVQSDVPEKDGYFDHGADALRYLVVGLRTPGGKKKHRDGNGQKPKRKLWWGKKSEEDAS
ncbi:MAG: hypothetical protein A2902_01625 [Elusimicrobia bacterium RIFCSPLOWO2_01_FULL_64_13]|nr:MAG: hypothetical protein A2902_01625 [Elusimicrobia bacterium RIFCSPLOWO2_01_FULL_64_13]